MTATYTTNHNGETATRKSANHSEQVYHYAVWGRGSNGWSCVCFSSRLDLARAQVSQHQRWYHEMTIKPVTCTLKTVVERPLIDFPAETFEQGDIQFRLDPKWSYCRRGQYRGWEVRLHCTRKTFSATAWRAAPDGGEDWNSMIYTPKGRLDSRVEKVKDMIDTAIANGM